MKIIQKIYRGGKSRFIPVLFALLLVVNSCKKVTDLEPNNSFSELTAFATPERVALAVAGVYSAAQAGLYVDNSNRGYPFGAANTEQGDVRGEDVIAVPSFYLISYEGTYDPTTANNVGQWTTLYALINRANVVIEGVNDAGSKGTIATAIVAPYEAECRFLRALAYHELLVHYARPYSHTPNATHLGVPLQLKAVNTPARVDEAKVLGRSTVNEVYTQILADLNFAETNLPATLAGSLKITRATKGAAIALKTRIYLHMNNWAKVIEEGNKVIPSGTGPYTSPIGSYALTPSPDGPFVTAAANLSNPESIFSIENSTTRNSGTNGSISTMYSKTPGRALIAISPIIWNSPTWKANDLRRTLLATNDSRAYYSNKYKDFSTFTDANPILRYAEVLLNVAEAESRSSTTPSIRALALLNAVRNRSVTTVTDRYTLADFVTSNSLTQAILDERRIEFLAEGKRFMDISRLANDPTFGTGGIPAKVSFASATFATYNAASPYTGPRTVAAIPYSSGKFIWPIPAIETNSNPVLAAQQNPDY
jgi:hypothetical protein